MTFDPVQYKATTRQQWEDAAEAWNRWGPTLETWLGPATEKMLDAANVTTGSRVLDVAAGGGGQTLAAARRVGPAVMSWQRTSPRGFSRTPPRSRPRPG